MVERFTLTTLSIRERVQTLSETAGLSLVFGVRGQVQRGVHDMYSTQDLLCFAPPHLNF
jgi:hypothetical protein